MNPGDDNKPGEHGSAINPEDTLSQADDVTNAADAAWRSPGDTETDGELDWRDLSPETDGESTEVQEDLDLGEPDNVNSGEPRKPAWLTDSETEKPDPHEILTRPQPTATPAVSEYSHPDNTPSDSSDKDAEAAVASHTSDAPEFIAAETFVDEALAEPQFKTEKESEPDPELALGSWDLEDSDESAAEDSATAPSEMWSGEGSRDDMEAAVEDSAAVEAGT